MNHDIPKTAEAPEPVKTENGITNNLEDLTPSKNVESKEENRVDHNIPIQKEDEKEQDMQD